MARPGIPAWLSERLVAYSAVLVTSFFGLISYGKIRHNPRGKARGDALKHIEMSEQTFAPVDDPFALRLLTPWLVKQTSAVTGVVPDTVWLALTFTATTCALFVVYEWLRGPLRISAATSTLAVLLLAVTFGYTSYNYGNFWLVDPLTNLAYALALFAAFRGKLIMFTLVMLVGFLNKETVLLLAPLYPLLAWSRTAGSATARCGWGAPPSSSSPAATWSSGRGPRRVSARTRCTSTRTSPISPGAPSALGRGGSTSPSSGSCTSCGPSSRSGWCASIDARAPAVAC